MRVVFLGTPEFATPSLLRLVDAGHDIVTVFTQPDRPKGRGNQLTPPPVKVAALERGLRVLQPERIRKPEQVETLRQLAPELMVVVGYGQIVPQAIIDIPPHGILNVHASLLPKYRGAAPIQWAIANGETETGVTIMRIDAGLDTGDMLLRRATPIHSDDAAPELGARLAAMGAELLIEGVRRIEQRTAVFEPQDNAAATLAPILKKEDGRVDWNASANIIYNRLRGFNPWPGSYSTFRRQQLRIHNARPLGNHATVPETGRLIVDKRTLMVKCGEGILELLEIQLEGKKRMSANVFLNGYIPETGERLGE